MTDIGWRQPEGLANATIDLPLTHHGGGASGHTPEDDCRALCFVLDQPLPKSSGIGFRKLIEAADAVTVECRLDDAEEGVAALEALLSGFGFQRQDSAWRTHCADAQVADRLLADVRRRVAGRHGSGGLMLRQVNAWD